MADSDDDMPVLSGYAQQALQQFLAEQQAAAQIEQEMLEQGEDDKKAEVELKEDWQLRLVLAIFADALSLKICR